MKVYAYDSQTMEYLGVSELNESDKNPLKPNEYIMPAATTARWPTVKPNENQTVIFSGSSWSLIDDYRGFEGWLTTGEKVQITELGVSPPSDILDYDPMALADEKTLEISEAVALENEEAAAELENEEDAQQEEILDDSFNYNSGLTVENIELNNE